MQQIWIKRTKADYPCSVWSGGRTAELAVFPPEAAYARRDFLWRVSSATVEREESVFTPLPDYLRQIAALEGEISLSHRGAAPIGLKPFRVHSFDGADETRCIGRCRDFNLMLRRGAAEGEMEALPLDGSLSLPGDPRGGTLLLYCVRGFCLVSDGARAETLSPGDSLRTAAAQTLRLETAEEAVLMLCRIRERGSVFPPLR